MRDTRGSREPARPTIHGGGGERSKTFDELAIETQRVHAENTLAALSAQRETKRLEDEATAQRIERARMLTFAKHLRAAIANGDVPALATRLERGDLSLLTPPTEPPRAA